MKVLVTGGAGYIGSHTCVELLGAGHESVVVDNLCNSKPARWSGCGRSAGRGLEFVEADLRTRARSRRCSPTSAFDAVIHFAGLKAVGESTEIPLDYYDNNVGGTLTLCRAMAAAGVKRLVFSSSATVYGDPASVPIREDFPLSATNPYGRSKLFIEDVLRDLHASDPPGTSRCCATSIRSAPIRAGASARTRTASRTT
jgi:UDP-glucose 4-epimerase